jgi:hypothetical protein
LLFLSSFYAIALIVRVILIVTEDNQK